MVDSRKHGMTLADWLSVDRVLLTIVLLVASYSLEWITALVILALAWLTDLLDGWVARKSGSIRQNSSNPAESLDLDGICDTALAFGSSLVIVAYAWGHYSREAFWLLAALYALTVVSGISMALVMNRPHKDAWMIHLIAVNMIVMHGVIQIFGTVAWFAYMAFDLAGVIATLVVAVPVVWLQRHKIQLWLQGKFA